MTIRNRTLAALAVGLMACSAPAAVTTAFAGNGNGHGNGNGGGNGHGNGGGNGNAGNHGNGSTARQLGALNAGHASATALANASPNSRVGKIEA